MTDEVNRGALLEAAVAAFEARFSKVDDHYMHFGNSRTIEGARFKKFYPGSPDVTQPVAIGDPTDLVNQWLEDATTLAAQWPQNDTLFWGIRPHFVAIPSGGVTIESSFVTLADTEVSDETRTRWANELGDAAKQAADDAANPAPAADPAPADPAPVDPAPAEQP